MNRRNGKQVVQLKQNAEEAKKDGRKREKGKGEMHVNRKYRVEVRKKFLYKSLVIPKPGEALLTPILHTVITYGMRICGSGGGEM